MVKIIRLRPSPRAPGSHNSERDLSDSGTGSSMNSTNNSEDQNQQENQPLRTISQNSSSVIASRTPTRMRKSATKLVMDLIESPRRVLASRKKRMGNTNILNMINLTEKAPFMSPKKFMVNMDANSSGPISMEIDTPTFSLLVLLEEDMPRDVLPKILSFAGPRKVNALSRVNKAWNRICTSEACFRTMCEDYGKWTEGQDREPTEDPDFWKKVYRDNPIVPLDFCSISKATMNICKRRNFEGDSYFECDRDVRMLVQPGLHILEREIIVEALGNAQFSVETHTKCSSTVADDEDESSLTSSSCSASSSSSHSPRGNSPPARTRRRLNSGRAIRNFLSCRSSSGVDNEYHYEIPLKSNYYSGDQATIVLKTTKRNCPIFHIRQGNMKLSNISLVHYCRGTDIWNGNSAVQIQARLDERHHAIAPVAPNHLPCAVVEHSKIMSISGRGIVAIDGSKTIVRNCYIHRCAATGIYVGAAGTEANVQYTDIVNNGIGNDRSRQGIARGHSGFYLEQGTATVSNCNISHNALTGLSAVSPDNAILDIQDSDLIRNGTLQLEMPQEGSRSLSKSTSVNNTTSNEGVMKIRSGLQVGEIEESSDSELSI